MPKQKMTILLIGLICFSSVSGFFIVMCCGFGSHIAVEPVVHRHCEHPGTAGNISQREFDGVAVKLSADHGHCEDFIAIFDIIVSSRMGVKLSKYKVYAPNPSTELVSIHSTLSFGGFIAKRDESSSFHAPLRTIILLA